MRILFSKGIIGMSALAVMGLASCTNENDPMGGNGQAAEPGEPTRVTLSLDLNSAPLTRGIVNNNATKEETTITHLNVFIYDKNGVLENAQKILMADLTEVKDKENVYTTKELKATTGAKTVYVGLNMTDDMVAKLKATAAQNLKSTAVKVALNDLTNKTDGFVMFSTQGKNATFVAVNADGILPDANKVAIQVERLASKIAVGCEEEIDNIKQGAAGKIQNLRFVVDNINTQNYFPYAEDTPMDPNMNKDAYKEADFVLVPDFAAVDVNWNDITSKTTDRKTWKSAYSAENVTTDKEMKGITRVVVQGEFIPATLIEKKVEGENQKVTWENKDNSKETTATTFIQLEFAEAGGYAFFAGGTTDDVLKEYMAYKKGAAVDETALTAAKKVYKDGKNYWWITTKEGRGDIVRNNFYQVNITSIWAPGRTDGKFDPNEDDEKVDEETNIEFTVTVAPWNLMKQDAELRP